MLLIISGNTKVGGFDIIRNRDNGGRKGGRKGRGWKHWKKIQYQSLKIIAGRTQAKSIKGRLKVDEGRHARAALWVTVGSNLEKTSHLDVASHRSMWNSGCCCGVYLLIEQLKLLSLAKSGSVLTPRRQQHTGIDWNELEWRVEKEKKVARKACQQVLNFPFKNVMRMNVWKH